MGFGWERALLARVVILVLSGSLLATLALGINTLANQEVAAAEDDEDVGGTRPPRFDFDGFCAVALAGDALTITGGGVTVLVDVGQARGNVRLGPAPGTTTVTTTPGSTPASRMLNHLVRVRGVVMGGEYVARFVHVQHEDCGGAAPTGTRQTVTPHPTRTPRPTFTPHPTRTPRLTSTPRPTRTSTPVRTPTPTRTPVPATP